MKTLTAFALAAGLTLSATALAEPFNDRGPDWTRTVTGSRTTADSQVIAGVGYNERGVDWTSRIPTDSPARPPQTYVVSSGYNEHSHVAFDNPAATSYRKADARYAAGW